MPSIVGGGDAMSLLRLSLTTSKNSWVLHVCFVLGTALHPQVVWLYGSTAMPSRRVYIGAAVFLGAVIVVQGWIIIAACSGNPATGTPSRSASAVVVQDSADSLSADTLPVRSTALAQLAWRHAGVYKDDSAVPAHLENVVLVTATNSGFMDIYHNWACWAKSHGMKWVTIALDEAAFQEIGPEHAVLVDVKVESEQGWGNSAFVRLAVAKLRVLHRIIEESGLSVVVSDADNVFLRDPFQPGAELGDYIRGGKFDYLYQFDAKVEPDTEFWSTLPARWRMYRLGNTGFHFVSAAKREHMTALLADALTYVDESNNIEDQRSLWKALYAVRNGTALASYVAQEGDRDSALEPFHHWNTKPCQSEPDEHTLNLCVLSPFQHPSGWPVFRNGYGARVVTYHANYANGKKRKIAKLKRAGAWLGEGSIESCVCEQCTWSPDSAKRAAAVIDAEERAKAKLSLQQAMKGRQRRSGKHSRLGSRSRW